MKAVLLAGGLGTRLSEETDLRPKPMVEIGGKPILWHIMKTYSAHGVNQFVICLGYKGYQIKEYFLNYALHNSNVTICTKTGTLEVHQNQSEDWQITLVDTGDHTLTGGRLKRVAEYLDDNTPFCFTYGDGVADIDITKLLAYHKSHGKLATVTAVQPASRFGSMEIHAGRITEFKEKPVDGGGWINGGYFVLDKKVIDYIDNDQTIWEHEPLQQLTEKGQLMAFEHSGFWQPMDTLREKRGLEQLWNSGEAPWKVW
ncbi:Glucose-1-phosphate cytidylyltransferase [Legionella massiliensis]|uniref:Glucose-1-phosphate cytidylyltransferase n=1 Tax=Legionella massiliensis TaxID=1034943 RepID=A0A078KT33_9GAMM|nr:glucose-1-phosphate cytidylyltransferase [Legionella massiliensis]CDZ76226.1 Glucose-1-phosphate cytidylyltransferase [Legionella massiliensis]CEE11964.1 Glucose-1-phosphate cytidylyltransferase [Legionella massiliensis]